MGDKITFNVDPTYDKTSRLQVAATLREVNQNSYVYIEDDWFNGLSSSQQNDILVSADNLSKEFDQNIYPKMTSIFGSEWSPGIDNDPHINIFVTRIIDNAGGYFNSADEHFRNQISTSNERELIYLNSLYLNTPRAKAFLAHEFQHMITYYQKEKIRGYVEDVWLNEARSEYAPTLLGYDANYTGSNLERRVSNFILKPTDSLTEWRNDTYDYSPVNLFMQYLVDHYGQNILTEMMKTNSIGIQSINEALKKLGFQDNFYDVFTRWSVANYLNDCTVEVNKYCYLNPLLNASMLKANPASVYPLPAGSGNFVSVQNLLKDWSSVAIDFLAQTSLTNAKPDILKLEFNVAQDGSFKIPYVLTNGQGKNSVNFLSIVNNKAELYLADWGKSITNFILVPSVQTKKSDFTSAEPLYSYSYSVSLVDAIPPAYQSSTSTPVIVTPNYPDGALIRARGDTKVYIVKNGKYKRWIQNPKIFNLYGHLRWDAIIDVLPEELNYYQESLLVRADGDKRVYEIDNNGVKHWLNMSAQVFSDSGRQWDSIYIILSTERNLYKIGGNVTR